MRGICLGKVCILGFWIRCRSLLRLGITIELKYKVSNEIMVMVGKEEEGFSGKSKICTFRVELIAIESITACV